MEMKPPGARPTRDSSKDDTELEPGVADIETQPAAHDSLDPFGDESSATVKYKTMAWWSVTGACPVHIGFTDIHLRQAGMIMIAETISLGILALPKALAVLGLLPGVMTILSIGIISTYTGYTIGQLKQRHMEIHSMADAGGLFLGQCGCRVLGAAQLLFFVFVMGSHALTFSIMMNVLTGHRDCTILYASIGVLVSFVLTLPRRLERLSHLSSVSFVSIIGAVMVGMIGVSAHHLPPPVIAVFPPHPTVHDACLALANVVFAYAGHVAFFTFFSELKDIHDFPRALAMLQICEMILYTVTAVVIYVAVGSEVTSPALNSAGKWFRIISYGIAMPTIVIGGVVNAHVAVKFIYIRLFQGTDAMHARSLSARAAWASICATLWILSWVIAEAIPVFNDVLGLTSSLFASWFSFGLPGTFWFYLNRDNWFRTRKQTVLFCINACLILLAAVICMVGMYSSIRSIAQNLRTGLRGGSFSCADNSLN